MKRFLILAVLMTFGTAAAAAIAQTPFTDSRQAAGEQYGITAQGTVTVAPTAPPPTTPPPTTEDAGGTAGETDSGAGSDGEPEGDGDGGDSGTAGSGTSGTTPSGAGTGSGSAAPSAPSAAARSTIGLLSFGDAAAESTFRGLFGAPGLSVDLDALDENMLGDLTAGTPYAGLGGGDVDDEKLAAYGKALGADLVSGGPLAVRFANALNADGSVRPLTALVATRDVSGISDSRKTIADGLLSAVLEGAAAADVPVIGIEQSDADPSNVPFFDAIDGVSIVDNVETAAGQASLKALVAGAKPGHYGTEKGADAEAAPTIDPDTSSAIVSGSGDGGGVSLILIIGICGVALIVGRLAALRLRRRTTLM